MHDGVIGVETEGEGRGCTFFFELPLFERDSALTKSPTSAADMDTTTTPLRSAPMAKKIGITSAGQLSDGKKSSDSRQNPTLGEFMAVSPCEDCHFPPSLENDSLLDDAKSSDEFYANIGLDMTISVSSKHSSSGRNVASKDVTIKEFAFSTLLSCPQPRKAEALSLRILIVDDTTSTRKITMKLLTKMGHQVEEACDGLDFLKRLGLGTDGQKFDVLQDGSFDVILMDDSMPNMCGPEATSVARLAGYSGLIFGVTGNALAERLENFIAKGADMVFTKPLDLKKLFEVIRTKLSNGKWENF